MRKFFAKFRRTFARTKDEICRTSLSLLLQSTADVARKNNTSSMVSPKTEICLSFTLLIIREESSRECTLLHFSHFTGEGNWSSVSNDLLINCWGTLVLRLRKRSWSPYGASPLTFFSFQPFSFLRLPQYSILGLLFWMTHIVSLRWPTKYHGKSFRNTQTKTKFQIANYSRCDLLLHWKNAEAMM